jgi:hypothetical protein
LDENAYLGKDAMDVDQKGYAYFITRGTELCDISDGVCKSNCNIYSSYKKRYLICVFLASKPNTCILHKLVYPTKNGGQFKLEEIKKYKHEEYHSNSWSVKIATNGRYLLAPTIYGQIFVFNLLSGQLTAIIKEHQGIVVGMNLV